jgi:leucyl/phenylalanyl-tRNA--protein transferase
MHGQTMQLIDPDILLSAYAAGIFPMADHRAASDVFWVEPEMRGILPLNDFHLPRSLAKLLRSERFTITADRAFDQVITACAAPSPGRPETWINPTITTAYRALHEQGSAHSIECWEGESLVGGLYGIKLGAAFFGESMFSRATNASKCALAALVARLRIGGFHLLDTQFLTDHLARFGTIEVTRERYMGLLAAALGAAGDFAAFDWDVADRPATTVSGPVSGKRIVQLLTHTS